LGKGNLMAIISYIIGSLGAAGFTGSVTLFGLSPAVSAAVLGVGRSLLYSAAAQAFAPKAPRQQVQAVVNQGIVPRVRAYGQVKLGGVRAFWEAKDGTLYQLVVAHHGAMSAVLGWEVDGQPVTVDGAGAVTTAPFVGFLTIQANITGGAGGDWAVLRAAFPTLWTTDHDLQGQSTYLVRMVAPPLARMSKIFPRQDQTLVTLIARGVGVFDPRTATTGYSDNAALCIRDYLTHPDGMRIPASALDDVSFGAFATLCDEPVALKGGGTEPRYRLMGYHTLEDAPKDVLARMLAVCDGQLYQTIEGKIGIIGGAWSVPDVTLTGDDILEMSLTEGSDPFTDFNVLQGTYTDPANGYQPTACAELRDEVALLTQPLRVEAIEADMVPSHSQMQRLLKIARAKRLRQWTGTIKVNLVGLKARYPKGDGVHTVHIVYPELGIDGVFEVQGHGFNVEERSCTIPIASIANAYLWDAATEEGDAPAVLSDLDVPSRVVPPPAGLTLSQEVVRLDQQSQAARIIAEVSAPGVAGLQLEMQFKATAASIWQAMIVAVGELRGYSAVLDDGLTYQVRARWLGEETWSGIETITAVANPTAPDAPTAFSHSFSAPNVTLSWTNGVAGFWRTRVFRATTTNFADAVLIATVTGVAGQASSYIDAPTPGATYSYWLRTVNASLVLSTTPTGPRTQVVP
jgi:hypothetical protein